MNWMKKGGAAFAMALLLTFNAVGEADAFYGSYRYLRPSMKNRYSFRKTTPTTTRTYTTSRQPSAAITSQPSASTSSHASVEQTLISLVNSERSKAGLPPLSVDSQVASAARAKASEMASKHYFSHTSPTYGSVAGLLRSFGVRYSTYGENIGKGSSAQQIHGMLMASSGHRANILNRNFTHMGIGVARSGSGYVIAQVFIGR